MAVHEELRAQAQSYLDRYAYDPEGFRNLILQALDSYHIVKFSSLMDALGCSYNAPLGWASGRVIPNATVIWAVTRWLARKEG